jgi:hypothetical protein
MNSRTTEQLAALIAQRHLRLTQLRDLGRRQTELIAAGEIAALLRLLAGKQQIIAAVQAIERDLSPFQNDDPDARQWSTPQARENCAKQASQCRTLIEEIMQTERDNERQMVLRQRDVADKLQTVSAAHKARSAYADGALNSNAARSRSTDVSEAHASNDGSTGIDLAS